MEKTFIRTYKERVKQSDPLFPVFSELSLKCKKLYNRALFAERHAFFEFDKVISWKTLNSLLNNIEEHKELPSAIAGSVYKQVNTDFSNWYKAHYDWEKHPDKYLKEPKLPKYKKKSVKGSLVEIPAAGLSITQNKLRLPKGVAFIDIPEDLIGITVKNKNSNLEVDTGKEKMELLQIKIIPKRKSFELCWVYEKSVNTPEYDVNRVGGIDIGLDNLVALSLYLPEVHPIIIKGKSLVSYLLNIDSQIKANETKKERLTRKRDNYINDYFHKVSRQIVNVLKQNKVSNLVIGYNKGWKTSIPNTKRTKIFLEVPYKNLIDKIAYKCEEAGINVYLVEESYTSGTSFIDDEAPDKYHYDKSRRIHRGLFKANSGKTINADVNAAFQIIKKRYNIKYYDCIYTRPVVLKIA